jgi:ketosteroid isomerase-like protein
MATYWPFYADELTQWWDTGRVSLEQYKKDWNGMLEGGGAILEARMDDVQVHVSPAGDAAVASYKIFVRMRDAAGKETAAWYHESDTWFRREDGWKIVHLHYSAVPQQPAAGAAPTAGGAGSAAGGAGQT